MTRWDTRKPMKRAAVDRQPATRNSQLATRNSQLFRGYLILIQSSLAVLGPGFFHSVGISEVR